MKSSHGWVLCCGLVLASVVFIWQHDKIRRDQTESSSLSSGKIEPNDSPPVLGINASLPTSLATERVPELVKGEAHETAATEFNSERDPATSPDPSLKTQFLGGIENARRYLEEGLISSGPEELARRANLLSVVSVAAILEASGQGAASEPGVQTLTKPVPGYHYFSLNGRNYNFESSLFPEYVELWSFIQRPKDAAASDHRLLEGPDKDLIDQIRARSDEALMWAATINH